MSDRARSRSWCAGRQNRWLRVRRGLLVVAMATLAHRGSAWAATFTVNSTADAVDNNLGNGVCLTAGGVCTLRAAIQEANALAGADTVALIAGTYTLARGSGDDSANNGDLDITESLTISGAGARTTIVSGGTGGDADRVFDISGNSTVWIGNLTVTNGDAKGKDGGGCLVDSGSSLTLVDVTVSSNRAKNGGGIGNNGILTLTRVTVSNNQATSGAGGGIQSAGAGPTNSLTNVTISGNTATGDAGGAEMDRGVLLNVTITGNTAGGAGSGLRKRGGQAHTHKNTLISGNSGVTQCDGGPTSLGNNLSGDTSCSYVAAGDLQGANPLLGALADNGGPTNTHALGAGSPAIDAGSNVGAPATDQRGVARPQGPNVDIGAFEGSAGVPAIVKRVFLLDGTPLADGVTVPRGTRIKFLLYINRPGGAIADVSLADPLDPGFAYIAGSIRTSNTVAACAAAACTPAEEAAIFAAADAAPAGSDAVDADTVSFTGGVVRAGNQAVSNAQLDIAGAKVYALVFAVRVQ